MAEERIRILIADDHAVVRKGLALVLRLESDFEVVGEAGNGQQAIQLTRRLRPDLILLDLVMPEMDGAAAARVLREEHPETKILILTGTELNDSVLDLLASGVDGYVFKEIEPHELKAAIRAVASGEAYLDPSIARRVLDRLAGLSQSPSLHPRLTPRELEVLAYMATPATYRQIAAHLTISEETVRSHVKKILGKLNQPNRTQAVLAAVQAGLIDLPTTNL